MFTLNNYTVADTDRLDALGPTVKYLVYGLEVGESGTPHIQGYVAFGSAIAFSSAKDKVGARAHLEVAKGTPKQAAEYCKKDGNFKEFGICPQQGKRSDWDRYKSWVLQLGHVPSQREIVLEFPHLFARCKSACTVYAEALLPPPMLTDSEPRFGWQGNLAAGLELPPNDRSITFVVDPVGNSGKSWFCRYVVSKYPYRAQVLRIGKRDDLSYAINIERDIFLFDIPRQQMTYLQYSVLESLKDRMIFSPKYESSFKVLRSVPHVIVFSNEEPDMNALSADRYKIVRV